MVENRLMLVTLKTPCMEGIAPAECAASPIDEYYMKPLGVFLVSRPCCDKYPLQADTDLTKRPSF